MVAAGCYSNTFIPDHVFNGSWLSKKKTKQERKEMTPLERLGRAITEAGYVWTEEMTEAYAEAIETLCTPLNGDQVIALWQQSNGHAIRFAALIESFHGMIPKIFSGDKK